LAETKSSQIKIMFSHIVVLWTDPAQADAADKIVAAANRLLATIPGVVKLHAGKMVGSPRPVVDQTYSVALNLIFTSREAEAVYQTHPQHVEFVTNFVKPLVKKVVIYDFE
jgi:hypothetical protein